MRLQAQRNAVSRRARSGQDLDSDDAILPAGGCLRRLGTDLVSVVRVKRLWNESDRDRVVCEAASRCRSSAAPSIRVECQSLRCDGDEHGASGTRPGGLAASAHVTGVSAVDPSLDPYGWEQRIDALRAEYIAYARDQHAICSGCPVVRSGALIVRSMLEWKAAQDGRLNRWTSRDVRDYLLRHLPTSNLSRTLFADAPTCAKDLIYLVADRGRRVGEDAAILADATDAVLYRYARRSIF